MWTPWAAVFFFRFWKKNLLATMLKREKNENKPASAVKKQPRRSALRASLKLSGRWALSKKNKIMITLGTQSRILLLEELFRGKFGWMFCEIKRDFGSKKKKKGKIRTPTKLDRYPIGVSSRWKRSVLVRGGEMGGVTWTFSQFRRYNVENIGNNN